MEFKGTKGQWRVEKSCNNGISVDCVDLRDNRNFEVCEVWGIDEDTLHTYESRANALLISKSPQLLEMLNKLSKHLLNTAEYEIVPEINKDVKKSLELIKEATKL